MKDSFTKQPSGFIACKTNQNQMPNGSNEQKAVVDFYERCGLLQADEYENPQSSYKRIDHHWLKIGQLLDENGTKKYTQLTNLALTVCALSHGNAAPERGFSINKALLASHSYTIQEDTIVSLRIVKEWINKFGGTLKFPITQELRQQVKGARSKYMAFLEEIKILKDRERQNCQEQEDAAGLETEKLSPKALLNDDIERCEIGLKTADEIIEQGNAKLQDALSSKTLHKNELLSAQTKISIGIERKRRCEKELAALKLKKVKLG